MSLRHQFGLVRKSCMQEIILIILLIWYFFKLALADNFPMFRNDSKSLQIFRTLLSILANLHNIVFFMVSTHPLISKFSTPDTNYLLTETIWPITIDITVTFKFLNHFFLVFLQGFDTYLSFCFPSILPSDQPERKSSLFSRLSLF